VQNIYLYDLLKSKNDKKKINDYVNSGKRFVTRPLIGWYGRNSEEIFDFLYCLETMKKI
jgi:hypothetical protein